MIRGRRYVARALGLALGLLLVAVGLVLVVDRYKGLMGNASAGRLAEIGHAIDRYTFDHGGTFPASLADLQRDQGLRPQAILCPETHLWTSGAASAFVYVGRSLSSDTVDGHTVVAYDPPAYVGGAGVDVLFGDGHTEWIPAADLPAVLARGGPASAPATRPAPAAVHSRHG